VAVKRKDLPWLALLIFIQFLFFPPSAFNRSYLLASKYSDLITQHLPHQAFIREAFFSRGSFPFWNPLECAGSTAYPNPLYFTPAFPHILLSPLPPALALNLGFFIHIALAGALAYVFARRTGCSRPASLFAAVVFSLGARSLSHLQAGFYMRAIFFAFIPLLFLAAERCLAVPSLSSSLFMAVSLVLALLSGELQLLIYTIPFLIVYSALRLRAGCRNPSAPPRRRGFFCALFGLFIFLPLSAFYTLPSFYIAPLIGRSVSVGSGHYAFMPGLRQLCLLLMPGLNGDFSPGLAPPWESALYMGIAPAIIICWAMFQKTARRDCIIWGSLILTALILSIRELRPLHLALGEYIPILKSFRNPSRLLYLVPFPAAILAAKGLDNLSSVKLKTGVWRRIFIWLGISILGLTLLGTAYSRLSRQGEEALLKNYRARYSALFGRGELNRIALPELASQARRFKEDGLRSLRLQSVILMLLVCICFIRARGALGPASFILLLTAMTAGDLFLLVRPCVEAHPLAEIYPRSALAAKVAKVNDGSRFLDASAPFAAAFWADLPFYTTTELGISRIDGYTPVNFTHYVKYIDSLSGLTNPYSRSSITSPKLARPELLSLLNAGFIVSESELAPSRFKLVARFNDVPAYKQFLGKTVVPEVLLYRNIGNLPRAWVVPGAEICPEGKGKERLPSIDPRGTALVPPAAPALSGGEPFRPVTLKQVTPNRLELELDTGRPSYLCLSEIWAPGWDAFDNGRRTEVLKIDTIFCGIFLPPGKHNLRLRYMPRGFLSGLCISISALAVITAFILAGRRRKPACPDADG